MALRFYFRDVASDLGGAGQRWLSTRTGGVAVNAITATTASGTLIPVTATAGGQALTWFSGRLLEAPAFPWSIPNVANVNLRASESANTVNAATGMTIEATDASGTVVGTALNNTNVPATLTELTTGDSLRSQTNIVTSLADVPQNGRIKITLIIKNAGTMNAGTATFSYNSPSSVTVAGSSYIIFNDDNVRFEEPMDVRSFEIYGSNGYMG